MIGTLKTLFRQHGRCILVGIALTIGLVQFAALSGWIGMASRHQSLVQAFDDDAGFIIGRAVKTRWYKDNGVAGYGPLYFRIAHTLGTALGGPKPEPWLDDSQAVERAHHFVLQLMSLVSVIAMAGLLAFVLRKDRLHRIVLTIGLTAAFLASEDWSTFVFRAHPDHMFAMVVLFATYWTFRSLEAPERKEFFVASAVLWGFATATKLTTALYLPAFLILFIPPFTRDNFRRFTRYMGWMFLGYFAICFPQSIVLDRPVKFLLGQSHYTMPMSADSFQEWWRLLFEQLWRPAVVLGVSALLFKDQIRSAAFSLGNSAHRRFVYFVSIPFLMLLTRHVVSGHRHYMFSFVAGFLFLIALVLRRWPGASRHTPILFLIGICVSPRLVPEGFTNSYWSQQKCRSEAMELERNLVEKIRGGKRVFVDPYMPLNDHGYGAQVESTWSATEEILTRFKPDVLALNEFYFTRYFDLENNEAVRHYIETDNPNWRDTKKFYEPFKGGLTGLQETSDSLGGRWRNTAFNPDCHWAIWERQAQ